ncbi:MAG: hypothetical protein LBK60_08745 [Verrucomicrobiales bacterium]|jgi:hypothetical protein|nr:hypothetical protein [Verrucomicrobiales bacterium]
MIGKYFRIALALTLTVGGLHAQDDGLQSPFEPSLGLAIPLRQSGEQVIVAQKFLLNHNVIINAGDQIRVIFPRPEVSDKDVRMKNSKKNLEATFSRQPSKIHGEGDVLTESAIYRAALDRATKTVWKDELRFRAYIDRMDLGGNILVFQHPGSAQLTVDFFAFPQDLFLGETGGNITVLAVLKNSQSQKLGIAAGATLTALNGKPLAGLEDFRNRYFQEKQTVENQSLTMTFILAGETAPKDLTYKLPRSLNSNLLLMDLPAADADIKPSPSGTAPATAP